MIDIKHIFDIYSIFQFCLGTYCGEPFDEKAVLSIDTADHYVCISDIDCQDHL